jgi:hypothetical protein
MRKLVESVWRHFHGMDSLIGHGDGSLDGVDLESRESIIVDQCRALSSIVERRLESNVDFGLEESAGTLLKKSGRIYSFLPT